MLISIEVTSDLMIHLWISLLFIVCDVLWSLSVLTLAAFLCRSSVMAVVRFYSDEVVNGRALQRAAKVYPQLSITTELCYNVELTGERLFVRKMLSFWAVKQLERSFINCPCAADWSHTLFTSWWFIYLAVLSLFPPLQAVRVSVLSRRRFSSGCFARRCRQSRCLRRQSSRRERGRNWWRLDPGTLEPIRHY